MFFIDDGGGTAPLPVEPQIARPQSPHEVASHASSFREPGCADDCRVVLRMARSRGETGPAPEGATRARNVHALVRSEPGSVTVSRDAPRRLLFRVAANVRL